MGALVAMTVPGLLLALIALGIADLAWSRARRGRLTGTALAGFDVLDGLFYPSKVHQQQERQRIELMRDDVDDGAPPFSQIDLESGRARLVLPGLPVIVVPQPVVDAEFGSEATAPRRSPEAP